MSTKSANTNNKSLDNENAGTPISLLVAGINGRMGRCTIDAIQSEENIRLVGAFGRTGADYVGKNISDLVSSVNGTVRAVQVKSSLAECLAGLDKMPDVLLDVTEAESAIKHAIVALEKGIRPVIGTSGLNEDHLKELKQACAKAKIGTLVVPNFSVGAVLLINFAKQAVKFFQNAEIVETHKLGKLDAPSGTAMHTARVMSEEIAKSKQTFNQCNTKETELLAGARGGKLESGVRVHSLRLPGILSKQDVYFANAGELLTLRHESHNTKGFEQGIILAINSVIELNSLVIGLDDIIEKFMP